MTKSEIKSLLLSNDRAVERAILALYQRQTSEEQQSGTTRHQNGRGFNAFDAASGTYFAQWLLKGHRLTGRFLVKARQISLRYLGQLTEISLDHKRELHPLIVQGLSPQGLASFISKLDPFQDAAL